MATGQLMFEVGIKETDEQLTKLEERLKNIVTNYGKLELKVQVDGLKAFTTALESIGQSKGLDALQKRIDVLQVTLANVGMSGAKSIQEFEAAVKTTSAVAEQYTQRINQMTAARDKFANGSTQWMSLNNKLTDFQNDKQVIAIYAQEQVAIKNLEDAKARLSNTNAQEVESYQKVISSIETLSTAANTLKTALGSWDAGKGNIAQLVEQFEKLHKEISGIATSLKGIDPSKLNFSGLNINVGNIAGLGDLNSAIRGLEVSINDIIRLFSNLANAVKLQPLDDQVKALLERCERAETKLRDVGEAARYLNERAGERTQQKSQNIAGIAGLNEENVERVSNLFERYRKLLADVQNQTANIGGIQNVAEKLGLNPTIVDQAAKRFEALWKTIENSMEGMEKYKGFPVLEKSSDQLAKIRAEFSALLSEYKQVTQEANNYNRAQEKIQAAEEKRAAILAQLQGPATKVNLLSEQNVQDTIHRIDAIGAAYVRIQKLLSDMGDWGKSPRSAMEMALGGNWNRYQGDYGQQMSVFRDTLNRIKTDIDEMAKAGMNVAEPKQQLDALYITLEKLSSLKDIDLGKKLGLEHLRGYTGPTSAADDITWASMKRQAEVQEVAGEAAKRHQKKLEELTNAFAAHDAQVAKSQRIQDGDNKARQASIETLRRQAEELVKSRKQMLQGQADELTKILKTGKDNLSTEQYDAVKNALRGVREEMRQIDGVMQRLGTYSLRDLFTVGRGGMSFAPLIANSNSEIKRNKEEKEKNAKATVELSDSEQRLANAVKNTSSSMRGQSQVLSDLKMMATQYLSVWGAQSFISNIIETGGLLEQQRLSLSAILGDMGKAQTLFDQIKGMALKSPFGVVELDKMSKQLAAYSFEYEELFEWTKRLADISAATGTSVDRLALALGHVRSEGALSGYTLRQFAMANVPVLRMLSENLGISSKEVRERVRKKDISAEDVQDILKQLTDDGGMFANAQETMSEALNAKFKNLRDAFDIMYGEIAESGIGDKLKNLAEVLTDGAKHWERLATDVKDVAIAFGIGKVAILMYNNALGKGTAITLKSALAAKQREIANLELTASYRQLTTSELATMANAGKLNATNIATLLSTKKLTYAELERAVALGKVDKAAALAALDMQGMHKQMALLRTIAPLQGFARMWAIVAYNIKLAGAAVKSFLASAWPLLALTAAFEVWNRRSEQKDNASDVAKATAGNARGREAYEIRDSLADSRKLSSEALKQNIAEMQNALSAANAYTDELKKQVEATDELTKRYDLLKVKIGEVADAYEEQKAAQESMMNDAWDAGGGFLSDNMLEDTKQFDVAMAEYQKKLTIGSKQIKGILTDWLRNQGQFKEEFAFMTGKQIFETLTNDMQESFLNYAWNAKGLDTVTSEMLRGISTAYNKVGDKLSEMRGEQGEEFASIMKSMYEEAFKVDLDHASKEQKIAFDKWLRETLARAEGLSKDAKEALRNIVIDFTIKLVPHYQVEKPQTAQDVIDQQIGDNKWLSGFFGRQNGTTGGAPTTWTVETAQKEVKKYKKLFGDISLSNLDTAPKKLNSLLDGLEETKKNLQNTLSNGLLSKEEKDDIQKSLNETTESIGLAEKALKDVGGKRQRKGDKGGKKGNDNALEKAKRQLEEIKKFYNEYKKFRDIYGEEKGQNIVENIFGVEHEDANRIINDYEGSLRSIVNELKKSKGGLTSEQRKKFKIDVDSLIGDIKLDKDKQKLDYAMKELQEYLAKRTEQWNLYNQLLEGTGDKDYAMSAFSNKRIFDDAAIEFEKKLKEISHETSIDYTMTEAAAEKYYKDVKGGYELWKKISEITSKNYLDSLNKGSEAWKQNMSYAERISAIIAKYTELTNRARAAGDSRGAFSFTELMRKEISGVKMEELRESIDWESVFNDLDKLTVKKLREIKEKLQARLDSGELDVKDAQILADKILETENKISEKSSFWASMLPFLKQRERLTRNVAKAEKEAADARHEYEVANSRRGMLAFNMAQSSNGAFTPDALLNMTQEEYLKALGLDGLPETDESVQNAINAFNELTESTYALNKAEKKKSSAEIRLETAQNILSGFTNDGLGGLFNNAVEANGGGTLGIVEVVNQNIQSMKELTETLGIADSDLGKAVSDIADISGNLVGAIKSLANGDVFGAINHVVKAGISIGNLFGLGQDDSEFEHAKANYEKLVNVWDELIDRKKTYLNQSWGSEAMNAAEEAVKLLNASIEETKIYGRSALGRGASAGSHSMRYRMWEGSYSYNGQNWQDVAGEISRALNVPFNQMEDMLNMSSKQLLWIKENYTGLWAEMDDDFKAALEQLIKYGDELQDVLDAANAKLSGLTCDGLIESYYNFVTAAEKGNDVLADDLESKLKEAIVKGMIENLYQDRIKAILEKSQELGTNDYYVDKKGKIKQHTRNAAGEITTDKSDIASEYTEKEYKLLMEMSEDLGKDEENTYNMLKEMYGWQDSKSTGLSSNIKNISEETADIIASYVNAMRADVAVNRQMISQYFPMYYQAMTTGNQSLKNIENHTSAIMQSNETIANRISALDDKVNGLKNGTWRMPVA